MKTLSRLGFVVFLTVAALLVGVGTGGAQTLTAFTETPSVASAVAGAAGTSLPGGTGLVGFEFTASQALSVTSLGFFAYSLGGGDTPSVTLYDVTSGLTSAVQVATTGTLSSAGMTNGDWNYTTLATPVTLAAGHTYAVVAPLYFSATYDSVSGFTTGTGISSPTYLKGSGWGGWDVTGYSFSTFSGVTTGVPLSANLKYTLVATPEPGTWALLLGGGVLLLAFGLRVRPARA